MKDYICIGKFIKTHGIFGELLFITYNPSSDALDSNVALYIEKNYTLELLKVENVRTTNKGYLIKIQGVNSIESAESFKNNEVFIKKSDINLGHGEYLISDLLGLNCYNEKNSKIGRVSEIYSGETDIIEIKSNKSGSTYFIPMTSDNILFIDINNSKIAVKNEENFEL